MDKADRMEQKRIFVTWLKQVQKEWEIAKIDETNGSFNPRKQVFAAFLGVDQPTFSEITNLEIGRFPSRPTLIKIADKLDAWRGGLGMVMWMKAGEQPPMPADPKLRIAMELFLSLTPQQRQETIEEMRRRAEENETSARQSVMALA